MSEPAEPEHQTVYDRILVALDGSELAERVLPYVAALAERFGSAVLLVRATTPPGAIIAGSAAGAAPVAGPVVDPTPIVEAERQAAVEYLGALARELRDRGLVVDYEVPEGAAGATVTRRAGQLGADLIAMTTHGRGGLGRLVFGSVADEVLRSAPCPVLLVRLRGESREAS
jgi:nucleotide-binding universal stress UspA family protein